MSVTVMGYDEAIATLRGIDVAMRARIIRTAVRVYGKSAADEMRQTAPVNRTERKNRNRERLRNKLGSVVRAYQDGRLWWVGAGETAYMRGQRHGHLYEFGHRIVRGGTYTYTKTYIGRKVKATRGQVVTRLWAKKARDEFKTGKGVEIGRVRGRAWMTRIIEKYATAAPEKLRLTLAEEIANHVAGVGRG